MFAFTVPVVETILRGSIIYLFLFFVLVKFKRSGAGLGVGDLLLLVLVADAAQNAMANDYKSVSDGLVLLGTLIFWNWFIDWLATRWKWLDRQLNPKPIVLVRDGRVLHRNMRKALVTEQELAIRLREHGFERPDDVKRAQMEGDGKISVIPKDDEEEDERVDDQNDERRGV